MPTSISNSDRIIFPSCSSFSSCSVVQSEDFHHGIGGTRGKKTYKHRISVSAPQMSTLPGSATKLLQAKVASTPLTFNQELSILLVASLPADLNPEDGEKDAEFAETRISQTPNLEGHLTDSKENLDYEK